MSSIISFRIKRLLIATLLLVVFGGIVQYVYAGAGQSARGWAWGGGVQVNPVGYEGMGWISFNDLNANSGGGSYGVDIPSGDGAVTGYAWWGHGNNVGADGDWLDFQPAGPYPVDPLDNVQSPVQRQGNDLIGWARFVGIMNEGVNAGGFDGWVKLSGVATDGTPYGVKVTGASMDQLTGYAWSSDLGWIDMSGVVVSAPGAPTLTLTALTNPITAGDSTTLRWTIGGAADSCWATGGWNGWQTHNVGNNDLNVSPAVNTTYTLECWNAGVSSGQQSVTVTVNSSPICPSGPGVNLTWSVGADICAVAAPAGKTSADPSFTVSDAVANPATGQAVFYCDNSGTWVQDLAAPETCSIPAAVPLPPDLTIKVDPSLIRSGDTTSVTITTTSLNDLSCDIYGATAAPELNKLILAVGSYNIPTTKPINNKQIVRVDCTDTVTGATGSSEAIIEVLPKIQEI
jgi:hypothetical protein